MSVYVRTCVCHPGKRSLAFSSSSAAGLAEVVAHGSFRGTAAEKVRIFDSFSF